MGEPGGESNPTPTAIGRRDFLKGSAAMNAIGEPGRQSNPRRIAISRRGLLKGAAATVAVASAGMLLTSDTKNAKTSPPEVSAPAIPIPEAPASPATPVTPYAKGTEIAQLKTQVAVKQQEDKDGIEIANLKEQLKTAATPTPITTNGTAEKLPANVDVGTLNKIADDILTKGESPLYDLLPPQDRDIVDKSVNYRRSLTPTVKPVSTPDAAPAVPTTAAPTPPPGSSTTIGTDGSEVIVKIPENTVDTAKKVGNMLLGAGLLAGVYAAFRRLRQRRTPTYRYTVVDPNASAGAPSRASLPSVIQLPPGRNPTNNAANGENPPPIQPPGNDEETPSWLS